MATIPSIAMIPSGVKASKLYSVLPTDGTGDFTTTRASVATRVNENGLIEEVASNVPRLDYSDGTCPSLLLEGTATNLITQSEDFSNVAWGKIRATVTSNSVISPDGTLNATFLSEDSSNNSHIIIDNSTLSGTYTHSIFAKKGTRVNIGLFCDSSSNVAKFDLDNGVILDSSVFDAEIKEYHNGWYRCVITTTQTTPVRIAILDNSANLSYQGDGTSGLYIWGAQLEQNSYATSYIKTIGTAQTRVADTATGSGSSTVINSTEGVLYAEIKGSENDTSNRAMSLSDGTVNNQIQLLYSADTNIIRVILNSNSIGQVDFSYTMSNGANYNKIAFSYKQNEFNLWVNGVKRQSDTLGNTPINLNDFSFQNGAGISNFYGKTKSLQVYTTALSDAELISLTTI